MTGTPTLIKLIIVCILHWRPASKRLLYRAACKHRDCGIPLLSFLLVGNTDNTSAKDMPDQCINKAFYTLNQTLTLCPCERVRKRV